MMYLDVAGPFESPTDLARAEGVVFSLLGTPMRLEVSRGAKRETIQLGGRFVTNHGPAVMRVVLNDGGVGVLPRFYIEDRLRNGDLMTVLDDWTLGGVPVFAVYPSRRNTPAVSALLGFLSEVVDVV